MMLMYKVNILLDTGMEKFYSEDLPNILKYENTKINWQ